MKLSLLYMGPFLFADLRFLVGVLTMFVFVQWRKVRMPARGDWMNLILLGLLQTTLVFALTMYGMQFIGAGKSSVILYSFPIWGMIMAYFYLGEPISPRKVIGLALGTGGLLLIIGWDTLRVLDTQVIIGEALIITGAICWAAANMLIKKKFQHHDKLMVNTWQMTFGTIALSAIAIAAEWGRPIIINWTSVGAVLFCGVLASAFCFTTWFYVLSKVDSTVASVSLLLVPVSTLFLGWLHLGEELSPGVIAGALSILLGVYFTTTTVRPIAEETTAS
jgi:drug/metabolite transporter (DMT)-like permease